MSERTTGATDEQIAAAARLWLETVNDPPEEYRNWIEERIDETKSDLRFYLQWIVPPTHRVVSVDDLKRLRSLVPNEAPEFLDDALALERIDELVK